MGKRERVMVNGRLTIVNSQEHSKLAREGNSLAILRSEMKLVEGKNHDLSKHNKLLLEENDSLAKKNGLLEALVEELKEKIEYLEADLKKSEAKVSSQGSQNKPEGKPKGKNNAEK